MELQPLSLTNIAGGAVLEVFERELAKVLKNIADVNTPANAKRHIVLGFEFKPFKDRTGAEIHFSCKSKLASFEPVEGMIFVSCEDGEFRGYSQNPQQRLLYQEAAEASPMPAHDPKVRIIGRE